MFLIITVTFWLLAQRSTSRPTLGVKEGQLLPCPPAPNCVSSQADPYDKTHYLSPIEFASDSGQAREALIDILHAQPNATLVENRENYLRAEFRSQVFGFVDDVEFLLDPKAKVIHFRSASRVGHSDLGANRKRMELIRALLTRQLNHRTSRQGDQPDPAATP